MTKQTLVKLSLLSCFLRILEFIFSVSLLNSFVLINRINVSANAPQAYISYEYKKSDGDFKQASPYMYYKKNGDGYDISCPAIEILGSKDTKRTVSEYNAYFKNVTKRFAENADINLPYLLEALKFPALFCSATKTGDAIEYKLYYGETFYKLVFLYKFDGLHGELFKPVTVRVEKGRISQVSLDMDIQFTTNGQWSVREKWSFIVHYDYEKTLDAQAEPSEPVLDVYKGENIFENEFTVWFERMDGDKYYCVSQEDSYVPETLLMYDLKTKSVIDRVTLPFTPTMGYSVSELITDKYLYIINNGTCELLRYDWSEKTLQTYTLSERYQIKAVVGEKLLFWLYSAEQPEKTGYYFADLSKNEFTRAAEYDKYKEIYYKNGRAYAWGERDGVFGFSILTETGESEGPFLELGEMDTWYFCADGIVFAKNTYVSAMKKQGEYRLYDWELSFIKTYETQGYTGQLWGETDEFVYYSGFVYDKDKDVYYVYKTDGYQNYTKIDGIFYNSVNGDIYALEPHTVVKGN